jgi:hypothetical protein
METTMFKKMSVALLAASMLAAPALAAGPAKSAATTQPQQTAAAPIKNTKAKTAEVKPTVGKLHKKIARHHRVKHRHYAHRHHGKVSTMHASAKPHAVVKTRLGLHKAGHKVAFNKVNKTGSKLSSKHVTAAMRRG